MKAIGTRYEIVRGKETNGKLSDIKAAGYAFLNEGADHYVIKLFLLPRNTYYLSKNRNTSSGYTIFAKTFEDEGRRRFQNPVGHGILLESVKTHLCLEFPDLASQLFMSLFPAVARVQESN